MSDRNVFGFPCVVVGGDAGRGRSSGVSTSAASGDLRQLEKCMSCGGVGYTNEIVDAGSDGFDVQYVDCPDCAGTGKRENQIYREERDHRQLNLDAVLGQLASVKLRWLEKEKQKAEIVKRRSWDMYQQACRDEQRINAAIFALEGVQPDLFGAN